MKKSELEAQLKAKEDELETVRDSYERSKIALQKELRQVTFQRDCLLKTTKTLVNIYGQAWEQDGTTVV